MSTLQVHAPHASPNVLRSLLARIVWEITMLAEAYAEAKQMAHETEKRYPHFES